MSEAVEESTHVWSHKARIAIFLSGMRHFRDEMQRAGWTLDYKRLDEADNRASLALNLKDAIHRLRPRRVRMVEPGDYRVRQALLEVCPEMEILPDEHFLCSGQEFRQHASRRKQLRLEYFYREMRQRHSVLLDELGNPEGGDWNFDSENRSAFGKAGPGRVPLPRSFPPDQTTLDVLRLVERMFPSHPGKLDAFDWPVTPEDAYQALADFVENRLPDFGRYQDAMWTGEPFLYHSRISAALNLKLLHPREVISAAERHYRSGKSPLAAVEGFIRQILGWREYVRGIYWLYMPAYASRNALGAHEPLPPFYWTADTPMNCLHHAIRQTLDFGYAHHIQRLMVTGLFALLAGVEPRQVHEWYLAVYVDAVEWVELPNTIGMSQFADGGVMASKPYVASGKYIQRMSNYCAGCRYDPAEATGDRACPFTTLYWDFLERHAMDLRDNPRMTMQLRNLDRLTPSRRTAIRKQADLVRIQLRTHSEKGASL